MFSIFSLKNATASTAALDSQAAISDQLRKGMSGTLGSLASVLSCMMVGVESTGIVRE